MTIIAQRKEEETTFQEQYFCILLKLNQFTSELDGCKFKVSVVILRATTGEITKKNYSKQYKGIKMAHGKISTQKTAVVEEQRNLKKAIKMQKTNRKITNTNPSLAAIILNANIKY